MISLFFSVLFKLPKLLVLSYKDFVYFLKTKRWLYFECWGLRIYLGKFGKGKTISAVYRAYLYAKQYPKLNILTNINLKNFPADTVILPLRCGDDIVNCPDGTIILIDEISTIFNSRDFSGGKGLPKPIFQYIVQCRHRRVMVLATAQKWIHVDKQLRDVTDMIFVCKSYFAHPFTRLTCNFSYDADEYDIAYTNPTYRLHLLKASCFLQSNAIRNLYDTSEMVQTVMNMEFIPDSEIMANRGYGSTIIGDEVNRKTRRHVYKNANSR